MAGCHIDPFIEDRVEEIVGLVAMSIVERGPLRVSVRIERSYHNSRIVQHIRLSDRSPCLEFATGIDWWDSHVLMNESRTGIRTPPTTTNGAHRSTDLPRHNARRESLRDVRAKRAALHNGEYAAGILNESNRSPEAKGATP